MPRRPPSSGSKSTPDTATSKSFHTQQAVAFKRRLAEQVNQRTGALLSKQTLLTTLNSLRAFFQWLAGQPGYRSCLNYSDSDYFNLSEKETRVAKASLEKRVPSIEQILHVLHRMPNASPIEKRNRAVIAFTLLTGVRDGATASLRLKHVDRSECKVVQDAREVKTKFAKTFTTWFFPVGHDVEQIVADWICFLQKNMLYGPDDPLFPATRVTLGHDHQFEAVGLTRSHWSTATPIRTIFKEAFAQAGLPYFNPHTFRRTLARLGEQLCHTPEEFKAWSQNLGHETVLTTFSSYGEVAGDRQAKLIRLLGRGKSRSNYPKDAVEQLLQFVQAQHDSSGMASIDLDSADPTSQRGPEDRHFRQIEPGS
jgi:integrase